MRYSLHWLFVAILLIAVSCAAMLHANPFWVVALRSGVVVSLSLAIASTIVSKGAARAFSIGFALVGWIHLLSAALDYYPPFRDATATGLTFQYLPYVRAVFHCILTATFAVIGGFVAVWLHERDDRLIVGALRGRRDDVGCDKVTDRT